VVLFDPSSILRFSKSQLTIDRAERRGQETTSLKKPLVLPLRVRYMGRLLVIMGYELNHKTIPTAWL
jgi:hypothetical protein